MSTPRYYFHGSPTDDANRVAGNPTATFDANAPTGFSDISQTGAINGNPYQVAKRQSVYWLSTYYTGPINGTLSFDWYWLRRTFSIARQQTLTSFPSSP